MWIAQNPENAEQVVLALKQFGFDQPTLTSDLFLIPEKIVRMGNPPLRIEIMTTISGVTFAACYAKRVIVEWDGLHVPVIALADLRTNKRASGRAKDMNDLEHLPPT